MHIPSRALPLTALLLAGTVLGADSQRREPREPGSGRGGASTPASPGNPSNSPVHRAAGVPVPGHPASFAPARIVVPRYMPRCAQFPDWAFWGHRDIMAEIQWHARQGYIPVSSIPDEEKEMAGVSEFPAGWKAYGMVVPPGGKLHVRLSHVNQGWFRLAMVTKCGNLGPGMLQNLIPTGHPEVRYTNPTKETQAVYVIVDDPGWMSSKAFPYFLTIDRDWDPAQVDKEIKPAQGIWAGDPRGISAEFGAPHFRASFTHASWW